MPKTGPRPTHEVLCALASASGVRHQVTTSTLAVHGDSYAWLPDGSVDLVLTDPPFNIAQDTNFHTYEKNTISSFRFDADKGWDTYTPEGFKQLLGEWAKEFARVLRPGGSFAVFCADASVSHLTEALTAAGLKPRRTLTWRKPNAVPINRKTMMMSACEYVIVGVKGSKATFNADIALTNLDLLRDIEKVVVADKAAAVVEKAVREAVAAVLSSGSSRSADIALAVQGAVVAAAAEAGKRAGAMYVSEGGVDSFRACVPNHVSFNSKGGNRLHPTEKPVPLLRYLTALLSNPGDVVLDPFGGSGSTGQAAVELGRRIIIVERDPEFFGRLTKRLRELPGEVVSRAAGAPVPGVTETLETAS